VAGKPETVARLERLRDDALALFRDLSGGAGLDVLGKAMNEGWQRKRELPGVTDAQIDGWYEAARVAGAIGGKLLGAGSGGFLLMYVPVDRQGDVRRALADLREFAFAPESEGTRIIYVGR
jgi:D-glycero-alpha-D-manno-heptose-7-phosphate kinase